MMKTKRTKKQASPPQNRRETGGRRVPVPNNEATRFRPGRSGNPGGRPKSAKLSEACRSLLAEPVPGDPNGLTHAEAIAKKLAQRALKGSVTAAAELGDRSEGRA